MNRIKRFRPLAFFLPALFLSVLLCACAGGNSSAGAVSTSATVEETGSPSVSGDTSAPVSTESPVSTTSPQSLTAAPETTSLPNPVAPENRYEFIADGSSEPVVLAGEDLRGIVVDYMKEMASVPWKCEKDIDYSSNVKGLIFEAGKTYLGMPYNGAQCALEQFLTVLEDGVIKAKDTGWKALPGNSCSTSILHAWQLVSPTAAYESTVDAIPLVSNNGVVGIGDIDWSLYDGKSTASSVVEVTDPSAVFRAYSLLLPGDALIRYVDGHGHMMMVSDQPQTVYNSDGTIAPDNSVITFIDQNTDIHESRGNYSCWGYMKKYKFKLMLEKGFLPVSIRELIEGVRPSPVISVSAPQDASLIGRTGILTGGNIRGNYVITKAEATIWDNATGEAVKTASVMPFSKNCAVSNFSNTLAVYTLPSGVYKLEVTATSGNMLSTVVSVIFTRP